MSQASVTTTELVANGSGTYPCAEERPDPFALSGTIIEGRYLIESISASGGFGIVYRARHLRFDFPVAIKVLKLPGNPSGVQRQATIDRLLWEGRLLFELGAVHPSIVRVLEVGTVATAVGITGYLAMEWLEGRTMAASLRERRARGQRPYTVEELLLLLGPLVTGLALAQRRGVAHRDIKPSNIFMVESDGQVELKLLDFGLAKLVDTASRKFEDTTGDAGRFTRAYAAPEQWLPRLGRTGAWTDTHALALVCAELLSGSRAFVGDEGQIMAACIDEAARPTPRRLGAAVSGAVDQVFAKALAVRPSQRFEDVAAFWKALALAANEATRGRARTRRSVLVLAALAALAATRSEAIGTDRRPSIPAWAVASTTTESSTAPSIMSAGKPPIDSVTYPVLPPTPLAPPRRTRHKETSAAAPTKHDAPVDATGTEPPASTQTAVAPSQQSEQKVDDLFNHDELSRRK